MSKIATVLITTLLFASPALAQTATPMTMDQMLHTPIWEVALNVTFTSSDTGSTKSLHGPTTFTRSIEREFSGTIMLDMRNQGANLSMLKMSMNTDQTRMQEQAMELVMRTDQIANWMHAGPMLDENVTSEQIQADALAPNGTARLNYRRVDTGIGLTDETDSKYNMTSTTTQTGSGPIKVPTQLVLEVIADSGQYLLTLSHDFSDHSENSVTIKTVTITKYSGQVPTTDSTMRSTGFGYAVGRIVADEGKIGEVPIMEGKINPVSGKIEGERTVKAHYVDNGEDIPGTLVFRYTAIPRTP